jgi:hypothetical protein
LIYVDPPIRSFFSWTLQTSKHFNLPAFLAPQSRDWITRVVEKEKNIFLGKCIGTLSPSTHIKMDVIVHAKSYCFSLMLSKLYAFIRCALDLTILRSTMSCEAD